MYNFLIPIEEKNEFLLYNSLTGGLLVLDKDNGDYMSRLVKRRNISQNDIQCKDWIKELIDKEYIVREEINEYSKYRDLYYSRKEDLFYKKKSLITAVIAPTSMCNMECSYCFEFNKPSCTFKEDQIPLLVKYFDSIIKRTEIQEWNSLAITWYGGEPLIANQMIEKITNELVKFALSKNMKYYADIITNGTLLTKSNWDLLKRCHVKWAQITIDGPKETHDKNRPLKNRNEVNYENILANLAQIPDDIRATIRVNVDKNVANLFPKFLDDLKKYKIWPHKYKNINIAPELCRTYEGAHEKNISCRIKRDEFDYYLEQIRELKFKYFNDFAKEEGISIAKYAWQVPSPDFEDCWSYISPYTFVIDAEGFVHKCWEVVHDEKTRIQHISEEYDQNKFSKWIDYNRFDACEKHNTCKYLPICSELSCGHYFENKLSKCTIWRKNLEKNLKKQYLYMCSNPDKIAFHG
jgi:uncharacterized protein